MIIYPEELMAQRIEELEVENARLMKHKTPRFSAAAVDRIINDVSYEYDIDRKSLVQRCRIRHIVLARWDMWYRIRKLGVPYKLIANMTNHDRTSVTHGIRQHTVGAIPFPKAYRP